MSQTEPSAGPFGQLQQVTMVVLLFQAVFLLAQLFDDRPNSGAMTGILAATIALSAVNRRLSTDSQGRHATFYITLWRYGTLTLLGALSVLVALRAYAPDALPNQVPTLIAMLVPSVIALKGAVLGKLKPGGVLGLRLPWTCRSRLAWEKAHRLMGRILFFGGLAGLVAAPFVPVLATFVGIGILILISVVTGAITSWRVWRDDPQRQIAGK